MQIKRDDLSHPDIARFLESHLSDMRSVSPPESKHALDLAALRQPDIAFYAVWLDSTLVACGALKALSPTHGELKSMRVDPARRRAGIASALLQRLIDEAKARGMERLSLETGSLPFFYPAHNLYRKFGFIECPPFAAYKADPNSIFFTRNLVG